MLGAIGFTIGAVVLLTNPSKISSVDASIPAIANANVDAQVTDALIPTELVAIVSGLRLLDAETAQKLLSMPITPENNGIGGQVVRNLLDPFTIIPDRPRDEVIQYVASQGDTIDSIAVRFGLKPETIAWSNSRKIVQVLRPGDVVIIPPADGVYIKTFGSATIAELTAQYKLSDSYIVLDSPYNRVVVDEQALTPDSAPRNGTPLFFPNGEAEIVAWQVAIEIIPGATTNSDNPNAPAVPSAPDKVLFQQFQQGSCPAQEIVGGTFWSKPIDGGYVITRGYSSYHEGIDLAVPVGTSVKAANGGRVVFAGWDSTGYGYMVAVVHGPTISIYGHLNEGGVYVSCGDDVVAGQVIGASGNTGNSSGPHLHFEIRDTRNGTSTQDPASILSF
jgi:murein DD-endopeptidase MepM/ murein hydrolase activator NlpD